MLIKEMSALKIPKKENEVKPDIPKKENKVEGSAALLKYQLGWPNEKTKPKEKKGYWVRVPKKWWLKDLKNLSPVERCILITLKIHANKENIAWPAQDTIADELKITRMTIFRVMKKLDKKGFYKVKKSDGRSNSYKLKDSSC